MRVQYSNSTWVCFKCQSIERKSDVPHWIRAAWCRLCGCVMVRVRGQCLKAPKKRDKRGWKKLYSCLLPALRRANRHKRGWSDKYLGKK